MTDLDKVIDILKGISIYDVDDEQLEAIDDAIALLKAQEPKVMTLEEVEGAGGLIYYERKGEYGATPAYVYKVGEHSFDIMTMGNDGFQNEKSFDYKIGWRCWTSRPTNEQRKAVKW